MLPHDTSRWTRKSRWQATRPSPLFTRWSSRGVLGVEMEAAALFTVAAIGGIGKVPDVHGGCLLTVSDIIVEGAFTRITDDELRAAVDRMTRIALMTVTSD